MRKLALGGQFPHFIQRRQFGCTQRSTLSNGEYAVERAREAGSKDAETGLWKAVSAF
jgi:hypothetical protein